MLERYVTSHYKVVRTVFFHDYDFLERKKKSQNCQNVYLIKESFLCNWGSFITCVVGG